MNNSRRSEQSQNIIFAQLIVNKASFDVLGRVVVAFKLETLCLSSL